MTAELVPFPEDCPRHERCIQESRIAVLEARADDRDTQLDRMESKLNQLLMCALAALASVIVALLRR